MDVLTPRRSRTVPVLNIFGASIANFAIGVVVCKPTLPLVVNKLEIVFTVCVATKLPLKTIFGIVAVVDMKPPKVLGNKLLIILI